VWQVHYLKKTVVCERATGNQKTQDVDDGQIFRKLENLQVTARAKFLFFSKIGLILSFHFLHLIFGKKFFP
jgi:hypothetical protein